MASRCVILWPCPQMYVGNALEPGMFGEALTGLGRVVALRHRSATLYQIR